MIENYFFFGGAIEGMDTSEGAPVVVVELAVVGGGGGGGPVVVVEALGAELVVEALLRKTPVVRLKAEVLKPRSVEKATTLSVGGMYAVSGVRSVMV